MVIIYDPWDKLAHRLRRILFRVTVESVVDLVLTWLYGDWAMTSEMDGHGQGGQTPLFETKMEPSARMNSRIFKTAVVLLLEGRRQVQSVPNLKKFVEHEHAKPAVDER